MLSLIIIHGAGKDDRIISDSYTITIRQTMIVDSEYRDTCQWVVGYISWSKCLIGCTTNFIWEIVFLFELIIYFRDNFICNEVSVVSDLVYSILESSSNNSCLSKLVRRVE